MSAARGSVVSSVCRRVGVRACRWPPRDCLSRLPGRSPAAPVPAAFIAHEPNRPFRLFRPDADGRFHFNSVAHDNAALSATLTTPLPPVHAVPAQTQRVASASALATPHPTIVTGVQRVHKFSHDPTGAPRRGHEGDAPDEVWIGLALWRIDVDIAGHRKRADIVCTANVPLKEAAEGNADGASSAELARVEHWWRHAVAGMRINDWGLFGDEQ